MVRMAKTGKMGKMVATEAKGAIVIGDVGEMGVRRRLLINPS